MSFLFASYEDLVEVQQRVYRTHFGHTNADGPLVHKDELLKQTGEPRFMAWPMRGGTLVAEDAPTTSLGDTSIVIVRAYRRGDSWSVKF